MKTPQYLEISTWTEKASPEFNSEPSDDGANRRTATRSGTVATTPNLTFLD